VALCLYEMARDVPVILGMLRQILWKLEN